MLGTQHLVRVATDCLARCMTSGLGMYYHKSAVRPASGPSTDRIGWMQVQQAQMAQAVSAKACSRLVCRERQS